MKPLRIALEMQFAVGAPTGLGVFAAGLARALRARPDADVVEIADRRFDLWRFDRRLYWDQMRAPVLFAKARADVAHFTGGTLPLRTPHPVVLALHDLVWRRGVNRGRAYVRWYFDTVQSKLARRADAIVVDTDAARHDVAEGLQIDPARIAVAGAGIDGEFLDMRPVRATPPYLLWVGTVEERKDLQTAVRALAKVDDAKLVVAGPHTPYASEVLETAQRLGVARRIEMRGYVDPSTLASLYAGAAALLFTSRYEGFGLPPLQALAAGVPVVAARIPVVEEVLGDSAWYAPVGDAGAFASTIEAVLHGGPEVAARIARGKVRAAQFTWEKVAEKTMAVYRSIL